MPTQMLYEMCKQGNTYIQIVMLILWRQYGRFYRVEVSGIYSIIKSPHLGVLIYRLVAMILKNTKDLVLLLVHYHILFKITVPHLSLIRQLLQINLWLRCHMINIIRTTKMFINALISLPSIPWLRNGFSICLCIIV